MSPERIDKKDHYTGKNKRPGQFTFPFVYFNPYCEGKDQTQDNPLGVFFHRIFSTSFSKKTFTGF